MSKKKDQPMSGGPVLTRRMRNGLHCRQIELRRVAQKPSKIRTVPVLRVHREGGVVGASGFAMPVDCSLAPHPRHPTASPGRAPWPRGLSPSFSNAACVSSATWAQAHSSSKSIQLDDDLFRANRR